MIGPASGNSTRGKDALQGLKPAQPFGAELFEQRRAVQIKPGWLDIEDDAQLRQIGNSFSGHEVCVRDAGAGVANGHFAGNFRIDIRQHLDRAVADGMSGELEASQDGGAHDGREAFLWNEQHAAIFWIGNGVNLAEAPRLAHIGASGEHAAIEEHLHADDAQHVVLPFCERMSGDALNIGQNVGEWPARTEFMRNIDAQG